MFVGGEGGGRGGVEGTAGWGGGVGRGEQRAADLGGVEEWGDGAVECFCGRFLGGVWISVSARLVSLSVVGEWGGCNGWIC